MRSTLEGTKIKRQHKSGFRARMATPTGREVINRRRAKGRHTLGIVGKKKA
ncbi:50S ribosomal protein L34 [bacterium]|nr:50S ribosomal protein L34 [bacterium]